MIKSDFHTHTAFSDDCEFPMDVMIQAAIDQGIECLAITDHYDPDYPDHSLPFDLELDRYIPVSYTHLDVYKRQPMGSFLITFHRFIKGSQISEHIALLGFRAYIIDPPPKKGSKYLLCFGILLTISKA